MHKTFFNHKVYNTKSLKVLNLTNKEPEIKNDRNKSKIFSNSLKKNIPLLTTLNRIKKSQTDKLISINNNKENSNEKKIYNTIFSYTSKNNSSTKCNTNKKNNSKSNNRVLLKTFKKYKTCKTLSNSCKRSNTINLHKLYNVNAQICVNYFTSRNQKYSKMTYRKKTFSLKPRKNNKNLTKKLNENNKLNTMIERMRKYKFICKPKPLIPIKFIDLPKNIKKINNKYYTMLKTENEKTNSQSFSVISKDKFSERYRNPFIDLIEYKKSKNFYFEEEKKVIKDEIVCGQEVLKMIKEDEKLNIKNSAKLNKKQLLSKFQQKIVRLSSYLKFLSVSVKLIIDTYKIYKQPFKYNKTKEFIDALKTDEISKAYNILDKFNFIVLDYDFYHLSPLHWAVKLNKFELIPKIIENGALINDKNFLGQTPLSLAIEKNFVNCIILLFFYFASPFIENREGQLPYEYINDTYIKEMCKRVCTLHIVNNFEKRNKHFYDNIQRGFCFYMLNEYKYIIDEFICNIIKTKYEKLLKINY